jgi:hypothetical protein
MPKMSQTRQKKVLLWKQIDSSNKIGKFIFLFVFLFLRPVTSNRKKKQKTKNKISREAFKHISFIL